MPWLKDDVSQQDGVEEGAGLRKPSYWTESHGEIQFQQIVKSLVYQATECGLSSVGRDLEQEREEQKERRRTPTDK